MTGFWLALSAAVLITIAALLDSAPSQRRH
jgi:hypothetical protein